MAFYLYPKLSVKAKIIVALILPFVLLLLLSVVYRFLPAQHVLFQIVPGTLLFDAIFLTPSVLILITIRDFWRKLALSLAFVVVYHPLLMLAVYMLP